MAKHSRKRKAAARKAVETRKRNEAARAAAAANDLPPPDAAADVVADNLPPPAAVAAAVADAAPAAAAADPAPAKRRRRRKGPFKGYKVDVERDGILYVLNRFGRAYVRWMKQGGNRQGFIRMLTRNYGKDQAYEIMAVLKEYGTGAEATTRKGKTTMQTRGRYPAHVAEYSLRLIMSLARKVAKYYNDHPKCDGVEMYTIVGNSIRTAKENAKLASVFNRVVKKHKTGQNAGKWYASLAAAKKVTKQNKVRPIKYGVSEFSPRVSLATIAKNLVSDINKKKPAGKKYPNFAAELRATANDAYTTSGNKKMIYSYLEDAIIWDPVSKKYRYARPLIGYGEGDMISVHDRIGGSIRGYGRRRRCCCKKRSSCRGGSIRGYGRRHHHHRRRRGGSIVGKGVFGLARKANKFARKTKILSKGARLLGYGMDSAGFLDKAW